MPIRIPRLTPPVLWAMSVVAMVLLHFRLPGRVLSESPTRYLGLLPIAIAAMFSIWAIRTFNRRKTTIHPFHHPSNLVMEGPYAISRNPMYVSLTLLLAGIAILLGTATPWAVIPVFITAITFMVIRREERMLGESFGESYREYEKRVRRWL